MLGVWRTAGAQWRVRWCRAASCLPCQPRPAPHSPTLITGCRNIWPESGWRPGERTTPARHWHGVMVRRNLATGASLSPASATIDSVALDNRSSMLQVQWGSGESDVYPYVWLRDNCRCSGCFHPGANSRTMLIQDLDPHARPAHVKVLEAGGGVEVVWEDGHSGMYDAAWLHARAFNEESRRERELNVSLERHYWDAQERTSLPQFSFHEIMESDTTLLQWLRELEVYGFVQVTSAPAETGQVRRLAERVAFLKTTHYGEDFTVVAKDDPSNVAYLSGPLQLHTDLPYYLYKPGVQLIHCIVQYQGEGGESQVSDAVHVARVLRKRHPHHFHILASTPVDWADTGTDEKGEFFKVLRLPVICTDDSGEVWRVNVSQPQRDSHFSISPDDVAPWYDAMLEFHRLLAHPNYCLQFKMTPGTVLCLDNLRVVHGRSAYHSGPGQRVVEGCYIDWDEVKSRRRVLQRRLLPPV